VLEFGAGFSCDAPPTTCRFRRNGQAPVVSFRAGVLWRADSMREVTLALGSSNASGIAGPWITVFVDPKSQPLDRRRTLRKRTVLSTERTALPAGRTGTPRATRSGWEGRSAQAPLQPDAEPRATGELVMPATS